MAFLGCNKTSRVVQIIEAVEEILADDDDRSLINDDSDHSALFPGGTSNFASSVLLVLSSDSSCENDDYDTHSVNVLRVQPPAPSSPTRSTADESSSTRRPNHHAPQNPLTSRVMIPMTTPSGKKNQN